MKSRNRDYIASRKVNFFKYIVTCIILLLAIFLLYETIHLYLGKGIIRVYRKIVDDKYKKSPMCYGIPDKQKFDCFPDSPVTKEKCLDRGCCYSLPQNKTFDISLPPLNVPYCFFPRKYIGYVIQHVDETPRHIFIKLERIHPSGFPKDTTHVYLRISFIDDNILRIKVTDAHSQRYEVPIQLHYQTKELIDPCYNVGIDSISGLLTITRKTTDVVIFKTDLSNLVYSDQLLQLSSELPSTFIYGIGEHYGSILRNVNWTRFTLINSDQAPIHNHGLYGSHPFYMSLDNDGKANGVFLFNSNIMDVILQPAPAITFRTIGGILDFYVMLGPSPKNVINQYSSIVGKTFMPPFWSLGFHLCRFGYMTLNKTRQVMQRTIDAQIPLDVQWNDIDYMDHYKDFTYDKVNFAGLPEFIDDLHRKGMHYVLMTDPGLSNSEKDYLPYNEGLDDDIFIKNANGTIFAGKEYTDINSMYIKYTGIGKLEFAAP